MSNVTASIKSSFVKKSSLGNVKKNIYVNTPREERDPNLRYKPNMKNRHLVITEVDEDCETGQRKRSNSIGNEEFAKIQSELRNRMNESESDNSDMSTSPSSSSMFKSRQFSKIPIARKVIGKLKLNDSMDSDTDSSHGDLYSSRSAPTSPIVSPTSPTAFKDRSLERSESANAIGRPRRASRMSLNRQREEEPERPRHRWTVKLSSIATPILQRNRAISGDASENLPLPVNVKIQTAPQFHTTRLEEYKELQQQKLQEKLQNRRNTADELLLDQDIEQLRNEIAKLEEVGQSTEESAAETLHVATLLYSDYLTEKEKSTDTSPTPVASSSLQHEMQLEAELTKQIQSLSNLHKHVKSIHTVTTIRSSDQKLRERMEQTEDEYYEALAMNNTVDFEPIVIDLMNPSADLLQKVEELHNNDGIMDIEPAMEESDEYEDEEKHMKIFDDDDDVQADVDSDENFLLNVNPSDKLEYCNMDELLDKCFFAESSDDSKYYIQTFATSFSSLLSRYSFEDIFDSIDRIVKRNADSPEEQRVVSRVIVLFGEWIFFNMQFFEREQVVKRLYETLDPFMRQFAYLDSTRDLLGRLTKLKYVLEMKEKAQQNVLRRVDGIMEKVGTFSVLRVDMLKLSMELTLIEYDLFQLLQPEEFYGSAWMRSDKHVKARNLTAMISCYNMLSNWVVQTILQHKDINERYKVLCRFISLAWNCVSVRNYNGCFAIIAGLYTTPIHRLHKTWNLLNDDYRNMVEKLMFISNVSSNYRNYRTELQKAKTPAIPNIAVHLKDFASIDDAQVDCHPDDDKSLNISKRHALAVLVRSLLRYQQFPFTFKSNTQLRNVLWYSLLSMMNTKETVKERGNRWLQMSRSLEPPPKKK